MMGKANARRKGTPIPSSKTKKVTQRREAFYYQRDPLKEPDAADRIKKASQSREYRERKKAEVEEAERIIAQAASIPPPHLQKPEVCLDQLLTLLGLSVQDLYEKQEKVCITINPVTAEVGSYSVLLFKDALEVKMENEM